MIIQYNNNLKHISKLVTLKLNLQEFFLFKWLAQSYDINPIKVLKAILKNY